MSAIFHPGRIWTDTDGKPIQAHGGGMLFHDGVYFWYGENKDGANVGQEQRVDVIGVSCYSSRDLGQWRNEGVVLKAIPDMIGHDLHPAGVAERPKVIFNRRTGRFVMWLHIDRPGYRYARAGVAVADRPTGPFTYLGSVRPCEADSRDLTVFQEDDGSAWLVSGVHWHSAVQFARLSDDYLRLTGERHLHFHRPGPPSGRESPAVFKRNGRYHIVTSGTTWWYANEAEYAIASRIAGPWTVMGNPCVGPRGEATFGAQNTHFFPVHGRQDAWIAMFDVWNPDRLRDSGYIWLPCEFPGGHLRIRWRDTWDLEFFAGR